MTLHLPFAVAAHTRLTTLRASTTHLSPTAQIHHQRAWIRDCEPLFETLRNSATWHNKRRSMYDRIVDVPRLLGHFETDLPPLIRQIQQQLSANFGAELIRVSLARYRDGNDSVAWHADRVADPDSSVIGIVSVGATRRLLLRPVGGGGSLRLELGSGDLLVMTGDIQRTWQHCVPKAPCAAERISVQFRQSLSRRSTAR